MAAKLKFLDNVFEHVFTAQDRKYLLSLNLVYRFHEEFALMLSVTNFWLSRLTELRYKMRHSWVTVGYNSWTKWHIKVKFGTKVVHREHNLPYIFKVKSSKGQGHSITKLIYEIRHYESSFCCADADPVREACLLSLRSKYLEPYSPTHQKHSLCSGKALRTHLFLQLSTL